MPNIVPSAEQMRAPGAPQPLPPVAGFGAGAAGATGADGIAAGAAAPGGDAEDGTEGAAAGTEGAAAGAEGAPPWPLGPAGRETMGIAAPLAGEGLAAAPPPIELEPAEPEPAEPAVPEPVEPVEPELAEPASPEPAEPEPEPDEADEADAQEPTGGPKSAGFPFLITFLPGLGKTRSVDSLVWQSPETDWMLALNISGRELRSRFSKTSSSTPGTMVSFKSRFPDPPVTVIGAQFMYISRFPTLLNQVHARVYSPGATPAGMEYSKVEAPEPLGSLPRFPSALAGQPPSMERMTPNLESLVGFRSLVMAT